MRHRRIGLAIAAVVAVAASAVAALALLPDDDVPAGCDDIRAYQERYGEIETLGDGRRTLTVLGDSYSAGDALTDRGSRWTDALVELDPDLTVRLDAIAFTGYANPGACGPDSYRDRIDRAADGAQTLVIQGGLNDVFAEADTIERAVADVLDTATAEATDVMIVGPMDVPGRDGEARVDALLAEAAAQRGLPYVSTLEWGLPVGNDRVHLTPDGHRQYADRILGALDDAGLR